MLDLTKFHTESLLCVLNDPIKGGPFAEENAALLERIKEELKRREALCAD
jgi:hypothetical protein